MKRKKTIAEYEIDAMLLGMNYNILSNTFNNKPASFDIDAIINNPEYDADTLEQITIDQYKQRVIDYWEDDGERS